MCICKFCNIEYSPRPQVKNPQACSKASCQNKRQRNNEKDWHSRNREFYDKQYYRQKKLQRIRVIGAVRLKIFDCIRIGAEFLGKSFRWEYFDEIFQRFFSSLGVKAVNKL